jgi:hypothetical protein
MVTPEHLVGLAVASCEEQWAEEESIRRLVSEAGGDATLLTTAYEEHLTLLDHPDERHVEVMSIVFGHKAAEIAASERVHRDCVSDLLQKAAAHAAG